MDCYLRPSVFIGGIKKPMKHYLQIALAIIIRGDEVLVQRRPKDAEHLPDVWEFPGGKVELNETPRGAAIREAREEVGLGIEIINALTPIDWDYPQRHVVLHPFEARVVTGEVVGAQWVKVNELNASDFPAANEELIGLLKGKFGII